jgi:CTP synthase (UTP-ammonia lyase)
MKTIAIIAEYAPTYEPHAATGHAIEHSRMALGLEIGYQWISTADITTALFDQYDALWVAPGSPYKRMDKALWAIQYAREHKIPTLGTCGGFQHMIIEYARNVLMIPEAKHAEYDPYASQLFISELTCSLAGREMALHLDPNSKAARAYGATDITEQYYCNFGVNPDAIDALKRGPIAIVGSDAEGEVRVIEYPEHPFFIATLYVPQVRSTPENPHPLIDAFLSAIGDAKPAT